MISLTSVGVLVVALVILGFVAWLVESAPFIDASFKPFLKWILLAVAAFVVVVFLLGLIGYGPGLTIQ